MARTAGKLGVSLLVCAALLTAERLPVRVFTTADGLLEDGAILEILQDSSDYLWFVSSGGLSRFDGQTFRTYSSREGLHGVHSISEISPGDYWISGEMGLTHYAPSAPLGKRFPVVVFDPAKPGDEALQSIGDGHGGLWVATGDGLYHAIASPRGLEFRLVVRPDFETGQAGGSTPIRRIIRDSDGVVWAAAFHTIYRVSPDGRIDNFGVRNGLPYWSAQAFLLDRSGRLWAGTPTGLLLLDRRASPVHSLVVRRIETRFGMLENTILRLCETPDGHIWAASQGGLLEWDGAHLRRYGPENGLGDRRLYSLCRDRHGNLWVGTGGSGAVRISRDGFLTFGPTDGIPAEEIRGIYSTPTGETVAVTGHPDHIFFQELSAQRPGQPFPTIKPRFPPEMRPAWGLGQVVLRDHLGETWVATFGGLARFPAARSLDDLDGRPPSRVYTVRDGLPGDAVRSVFEDSRGDVWFGSVGQPRGGLARWVRGSDRMEDLSHLPTVFQELGTAAFAETASGSLWIAFPLGLVRYRDGKFESYPAAANDLPASVILSLHVDRKGNVWGAGHEGGIFQVKDPDSDRPRFVRYGEAQGLSSNQANCVTSDEAGHIYAGTFAGVNRLDPETGEIRHFTTADGLAGNLVLTCAHDAAGNLWFGTTLGLSRLRGDVPPDTGPAAEARITAVQLADRALAISDLGETAYAGPTLRAGENHLQISFAAADTGGALRYRYKLESADRDWSKPTTVRTVSFANLAPGEYRFLVKAVGFGENSGSAPASFTFTILPPMWRRWWFIALALVLACAVAYSAYRFRLEQLLRVERVRNRIATDLHDDIGSALSQISLLSEVAHRQQGGADRAASLERIATVARETTRSISDIVWAINPQRDSLGDLSVRIRSFAAELCSARDIDCVMNLPDAGEDLPLDIDTRRQLLLIAKEAIHNLVRHAGCTEAVIELKREGRFVVLRVEDNGRGFLPGASRHGHGLDSMRARAESLGGTMTVDSRAGRTRLEFYVPV